MLLHKAVSGLCWADETLKCRCPPCPSMFITVYESSECTRDS